jgi:hypothetical protein
MAAMASTGNNTELNRLKSLNPELTLQTEPDYRRFATVVTIVMAPLLASLGLVLQIVAYELNALYFETTLPAFSKPLIEWFGLRPHAFLFHLTFMFWWLFLAVRIHTSVCYPNNQVFLRVYVSRFILCGMALALYLAIFGYMAASPAIILLADIRQPPEFTKWIPIVSGWMPFLFALVAAFWLWRKMEFRKNADGQWELTTKHQDGG